MFIYTVKETDIFKLPLPLFVVITLSICSPSYCVARALAVIGEEINREHRNKFQGLVDQLRLTENNAYEVFANIVKG